MNNEGTPMTSEQLARYAVTSVVKVMVVKWTIIIIGTKVLTRAAKKAAS